MRQRWLRVLFRRRMLTILLLLLQVYFLMPCTWGKSAFPKFQSPTDNRQYHCGALYRFPERQRRLQNCMGDPDPNLPVVWWTDVSFV